jgi:hypothetical protein
VIVVVGSPVAEPEGPGIRAGGLAAGIARAAAASGAAVQIVGRVGEDAAGDQVLLHLAASGVGHVAVLREAGQVTPAAAPGPGESTSPDGPSLGETVLDDDDPAAHGDDAGAARAADDPPGLSVDAADLELALRYIADYCVLVLAAEVGADALAAVVAATGWSGAHLVALVREGSSIAGLPDATTILLRPPGDPDGAFASTVAAYAVELDQGSEPAAAFAAAQRAGGWAAVAD